MYNVIKIDSKTGKENNYGRMCEEDMKEIIKGYKFNGLFYERENSKYMYIVEKIATL